MQLVDKAIDACVAAIEIYNKPDFRYREEAFSILMFNAWELLLKARVLKENRGEPRSIEIWEPVRKKDGTNSKRSKVKLNRSKSAMTIDGIRAAALVRSYATDNINDACIDNLNLLAEVRDSCVTSPWWARDLANAYKRLGLHLSAISCTLRRHGSSAISHDSISS